MVIKLRNRDCSAKSNEVIFFVNCKRRRGKEWTLLNSRWGFRFLRVVVIFLRSLSCKEIHRKVMTSEILNSSTTFFGSFFRKDAMKHRYYISPDFSGSIFLLALSSSKGISDYFVFLCFEDNFFPKSISVLSE